MTTVRWKQALVDRLLSLANRHDSCAFELEEVYEFESELAHLFPTNRHVRPKIRQTLQRLRDDGLLLFQDPGHYEMNLSNSEIISAPAQWIMPKGTEHPPLRQTRVCLRLRSTVLGMEMKKRYNDLCQVCGIPVQIGQNKNYTEAHHLHPLGSPHDGPDVPGNIIVLCPNHHIMFDRGAATILPRTYSLMHKVPHVFSPGATLRIEPWHKLNQKSVRYHHEVIFITSK